METRRLKNIAILILLLLNAFLLLLLGYQELLGLHAEQESLEELKTLFAADDLALALEEDVIEKPLTPLKLARKMESEASIAAFLLGDAAQMRSEGGGICSYTTQAGTVRFRSGGGFDTAHFSRVVEDTGSFAQLFCDKFGYRDIRNDVTDGTGVITASQYIAGVPILGCSVALTFEKGALVSAVGAHIDLSDAETENEQSLSGVSALVRFFDYRNREGIVCRMVTGLRCVYQLSGGTNVTKLRPVWILETDSYLYLVDGISGGVTRG